MPTFQDFLDEIKAAGVVVRGEAILVEQALSSPDWPSKVAELARAGRKGGVRFELLRPQQPSHTELHRIVGGYNFAAADRNAVPDNTMLIDPDESGQALHEPAFTAKLNDLREHFHGRRS